MPRVYMGRGPCGTTEPGEVSQYAVPWTAEIREKGREEKRRGEKGYNQADEQVNNRPVVKLRRRLFPQL